MKSIIVGTAGHIDHGKTAMVKALTGEDTDRLLEEKRRGISIELGFAHLDLGPDLRLGFVDVPGHERFVKNMLAGVGGIDLVLFVVAADASVMPQTREHFDICRLLGVSRGLFALTKSDLVDEDRLELVRMEVDELAAGSFLEHAPRVPVSSTTGAGLDELRRQLEVLGASIPPKDASQYFRLPIDRSFSARGFGTIITGTLVSGTVSREQEVEAQPGGRSLRVRGIQVHGGTVEKAFAGQRTALNLSGAEPSDVLRGTLLTEPGRFQPVQVLDCLVELLPSAKPLKNRAPVHFHAGTSEVPAEVRLMDRTQLMRPGSQTYARFILRKPLLLLPGDRFIVRMFSPVVTIGGGRVLDISGHRYRSRENPSERLKLLAEGTKEDGIALLVRESAYGRSVKELVALTGLLEGKIEASAIPERLVLLHKPQPWLFDHSWLQSATERLTNVLHDFHREKPLLQGMPKEELRSALLPGAPSFLLDALLERTQHIALEGDIVRLEAHQPVLQDEEHAALERLEGAFRHAGLEMPSLAQALAASGLESRRAMALVQLLLRKKRLVKVKEDLVLHQGAIEGLVGMLAKRKGERFTVPDFKTWTGISRKYAIPLLEYLDRVRVTRREGNERVIL